MITHVVMIVDEGGVSMDHDVIACHCIVTCHNAKKHGMNDPFSLLRLNK